jgi:hypothetical protein
VKFQQNVTLLTRSGNARAPGQKARKSGTGQQRMNTSQGPRHKIKRHCGPLQCSDIQQWVMLRSMVVTEGHVGFDFLERGGYHLIHMDFRVWYTAIFSVDK